ncbi:CLUMA_CG008897, isoform A [Clunio marinus]|uniref:CLUMA_CG008897, isoform A n=1 Tax=Clunio marinus TaxID=568069 RepID=A0A1J1I687_9DIPT|nr:CLUMA_CG008897, isoform A [Clunio marinus]
MKHVTVQEMADEKCLQVCHKQQVTKINENTYIEWQTKLALSEVPHAGLLREFSRVFKSL